MLSSPMRSAAAFELLGAFGERRVEGERCNQRLERGAKQGAEFLTRANANQLPGGHSTDKLCDRVRKIPVQGERIVEDRRPSARRRLPRPLFLLRCNIAA